MRTASYLWSCVMAPLALACVLLGALALHSMYHTRMEAGRATAEVNRLEDVARGIEREGGESADLRAAVRSMRESCGAMKRNLARDHYWAVWLLVVALLTVLMLIHAQRSYSKEIAVRRQMEVLLKQSEAGYRSLFENVLEGVYRSSSDGRVLAANPALVAMLGFSGEEELKRADIAHDVYVDPERRARLTAQLERDGVLRSTELRLRRRDGVEIVALENARAVRGKNGALLYYEGTLSDITERKRSEEEAARRVREVEEARAKLETQAGLLLEQSFELAAARDAAVLANGRMVEFLAYLGDRLSKPASGLLAESGMLLDSSGNELTREQSRRMLGASVSILRLAEDLRHYASLERKGFQPDNGRFSVRDLVEGVIEEAAARAEQSGLELCYLVSPSVPGRVWGDEDLLRMVLRNLVDNALSFTRTGEVNVRVLLAGQACPQSARREDRVPGDAAKAAVRQGRVLLRFEVEDTGEGIPAADLGGLFEPFARVPEIPAAGTQGSGLGLAICRRIAERMDGGIEVSSEPGQGSLFTFSVWLEAEGGEQDVGPEPLAGQRILIADDVACARGMLAELCAGWGIDCQTAEDGEEALRLIEQAARNGTPFDLIIADYQMPGPCGVELAAAVLDSPHCAGARFLLLTPWGSPEEEEIVAGVAGTLCKPVLESHLYDKLIHALKADPMAEDIARLATGIAGPEPRRRRTNVTAQGG